MEQLTLQDKGAALGNARAGVTVARVLDVAWGEYIKRHAMPLHHYKTLCAIRQCRTPALGGHLYECTECGRSHFVPHSCRNRHCPVCQGHDAAEWLEKQEECLLPVNYFHLVFTLPHALNPLIQQNQAALYNLLFAAASATLLEFGRVQMGAKIGVTAVLHTWSRTLLDHYHLHCIVTGGGLRLDGNGWADSKPHWLFPVRALQAMFKSKMLAGITGLLADDKLVFEGELAALKLKLPGVLKRLSRQKWVVYAKRPFAGPETVLAYLSRYTHRIGITNRQITGLDEEARTVTFTYKDYADGSRHKSMTLGLEEFVRRIRLHILPPRMVKIRHYGILSTRNRKKDIALARAILGDPVSGAVEAPSRGEVKPGEDRPPRPLCPFCQKPALVLTAQYGKGKTPAIWNST